MKNKLDIPKMEDEMFRFIGVYIKTVQDNIEVCMTDNTNSLERKNIIDGKADETLKERNSFEGNFTTKYRKNTWIHHWKTHIWNISSKNFTGSKSGNRSFVSP